MPQRSQKSIKIEKIHVYLNTTLFYSFFFKSNTNLPNQILLVEESLYKRKANYSLILNITKKSMNKLKKIVIYE